jgi:hypothetical protein
MDLLEMNHELGAPVQQPEGAMRSQGRCGIATGLVMAHNIEVDDAFATLVRESQESIASCAPSPRTRSPRDGYRWCRDSIQASPDASHRSGGAPGEASAE